MEIKILGSGSKGNCYWVSDGWSSVLLDAGLPFREIQRGTDFKIAELSACLITHEHGDHIKAVGDMIRFGVDCFMSWGTAKALPDKTAMHRVKVVSHGEEFTAGTFTIMAFRAIHDSAEPLGFFLRSKYSGETLLYATDTCYLPNRFDGMNYIMLEVNYCQDTLDENVKTGRIDASLRNRIVRSHMSLQTALGFFRANDLSQVKEITLIHLSDSNSQAEKILREVQKATGKLVKIA